MNLLETALKYREAGLDVIPDHPTEKYPYGFPDWQIRVFSTAEISNLINQGWHIGIRNQEGLDFDNHGDFDAVTLLKNWKEMVDKLYPGLVDRLLVEKSRNGGFHVIWKCEVIEDSQKLANRPPTEEEIKTRPQQKSYVLIETRGKGGQFVVSPSPGYEVIQGDWFNLTTITPDQREALLDCARSFDQMPKKTYIPVTKIDDELPGEVYNRDPQSPAEVLQLLKNSGWTEAFTVGNELRLCRPGKDHGVSATFNSVAPGWLYNFSSSVGQFDAPKGYSPFQIFALLKHNGDFSAAARELSQRLNIATQLPKKEKSPIRYSDTGNAEVIIEHHGDRVRFDHRRNRWLIWSTHRWEPDNDGGISRIAVGVVRKRYSELNSITNEDSRKKAFGWLVQSEGKGKIDATLGMLRNLKPVADAGDDWDGHSMILSCKNGLVDLTNGELLEGKPEDKITMSTGINYDPDAKCPRWEKFVSEIFEGRDELIHYIHKALGYSLTADMREQILFFCYGPGNNGKTVLFSIMRKVLGDYTYDAPSATFLNQGSRSQSNSNDLAAFEFKRFVISSEVLGGKRVNETLLKNISGGDPVTARFLYSEFFTFNPVCKIWLFVNHRPIINDDSFGFWRRVKLIPFTRIFKPEEQDDQLTEKLIEELPGILNWLIQGCMLWQKEGLATPEMVETATSQYQRESDTLADFIGEKCRLLGEVKPSALWKAYDFWANEQGFEKGDRLGSKGFYQKLGERFKHGFDQNGAKIYRKISLISENTGASSVPISHELGLHEQNAKTISCTTTRKDFSETGASSHSQAQIVTPSLSKEKAVDLEPPEEKKEEFV